MQKQKKTLLYAVISLLIHHSGTLADAFAVSSLYSSTSTPAVRSTVTAVFSRSQGSPLDADDFFDAESVRQELENLMLSGGGGYDMTREASSASSRHQQAALRPSSFYQPEIRSLPETPILDVNLPPRPPLTTIERERRSTEIVLLAHLSEGDDVLSDLWNLWFAERGPKAARLLRQADDLINNGKEGWGEAEQILRALIEVHGVYFTEPLNRLATLYLLQGKLSEALTLNQMVLAVKPWHIGALSHIVMVYAGMGEHFMARQWATFRLPNVNMIRRRNRWVEKSVVDATAMLHLSEEHLSNSFGEPDRVWIHNQGNGDPWQ